MMNVKFAKCSFTCDANLSGKSFRVYCRREPNCLPGYGDIPKQTPKSLIYTQTFQQLYDEKYHVFVKDSLKPASERLWKSVSDYRNSVYTAHATAVRQALQKGKDVPATVLKDYPKLVAEFVREEPPFQRGDMVVSSEPGVPAKGEIWLVEKREDTGWHIKLRGGKWWPARYFTKIIATPTEPKPVIPSTPWDAKVMMAKSGRILKVVDLIGKTIPRTKWKGVRILVYGPRVAEEVIDRGGIAIDFTEKKRWIKVGRDIILEGEPPIKRIDWPTEKIKNLMADIRIAIGNFGKEGATLDDVRHIFKDRGWMDIQSAITQLIADAQIREISPEKYVSSDPRVFTR